MERIEKNDTKNKGKRGEGDEDQEFETEEPRRPLIGSITTKVPGGMRVEARDANTGTVNEVAGSPFGTSKQCGPRENACHLTNDVAVQFNLVLSSSLSQALLLVQDCIVPVLAYPTLDYQLFANLCLNPGFLLPWS
jgi:hypothetical protein